MKLEQRKCPNCGAELELTTFSIAALGLILSGMRKKRKIKRKKKARY